MQKQIKDRMKQLDWTLYKVAKLVAELRAKRDNTEPSPATRYHTTIDKALECPSRSKLETLNDVVEVLGGRIKIIWNQYPQPTEETTRAYTLKLFDGQGNLINLSFFTRFDTALSAMMAATQTGSKGEIFLDSERLLTSDQIPDLSKEADRPQELQTKNSCGWVVIR